MTLREAIDRTAARLTPLYDPREARNLARRIVAEYAAASLSELLTDPAREVEPEAAERLEAAARRLAKGEPLQYILGAADFYGHRFAVREGVLIPRPETEELVDWILREEPQAGRMLDIGTGSGCIAASLALARPGAEVLAADLSSAALAAAAANCRSLGARVTIRRADALGAASDAPGLEEAFGQGFDLFVSNPPYVPESDRAAMHPNVRDHEPAEALFVPDDDRFRFYRAIARAGRRMLRPGGALYFEIYEHAAGELARLLADEGYEEIELREDLFGRPRMARCRKPARPEDSARPAQSEHSERPAQSERPAHPAREEKSSSL